MPEVGWDTDDGVGAGRHLGEDAAVLVRVEGQGVVGVVDTHGSDCVALGGLVEVDRDGLRAGRWPRCPLTSRLPLLLSCTARNPWVCKPGCG